MTDSEQRNASRQRLTGVSTARMGTAWVCLIVVALTAGAATGKSARRKTRTWRAATARTSFKREILPILQGSCALESGCHVGQAAAAGLRLDGPDPYAALVNAPSSLKPTRVRVKPGKPDESVLWLKLTGKHKQAGIFGDRMPLDKPLPPSEMRVIERWIRQGALR
jgi:hypothetical protein